jgi:hypothetical protein
VITKIEKKANNNYLVYETLKVALIPFSFTYPVTVTAYPEKSVVIMRATVMKLNKIEMVFAVKASGDFTMVDERIKFNSPLPVAYILQRVFKEQHAQLFKNIALSV